MKNQEQAIISNHLMEIIKNVQIPAFIENEEGEILFANDNFVEKSGGKKFENKKLFEIIKPQTLHLSKIPFFESVYEIPFFEFDGQSRSKKKYRKIKIADLNIAEREKVTLSVLIEDTIILSELKYLKKKRKLFDLLLDNTDELIFYKNNNGEYLFANKSYCNKVNISKEDIVGKSDIDILGKYKAQDIIQEEKEILKTKTKIVNVLEKEVSTDGKTSWYVSSKIPLLSDDGEVLGLLGISKDITRLKKIEQENDYILKFQKLISQVSAIFLKNTFSNFNTSLTIVLREIANYFDANYCYIFQLNEKNNEFIKVVDYPSKSTTSRLIDINEYKSWLSRLEKGEFIYQSIDQTTRSNIEHQYFLNNKIEQIILIPLFNYSVLTGFLVIHLDNKSNTWIKDYPELLKILSEIISNSFSNYDSEKYRLEAEEEMLKLLRAVNQSTDAIIIMDQNFNIEYANNKYVEMTGIFFEELLGRQPFFFSNNINIKWNTKDVLLKITNGESIQGIYQDKYKNGESYWGKISVSPIKNYKGEITNHLAMIEDITEKMIADSRREVSQKLESIGQLAAGIAHEINTPMQYINDNNKFISTAINSLKQFLDELIKQISKGEDVSKSYYEKLNQLKETYDIEFLLNEIPEALRQSEEGIKRVTTIIKAMKDFAHPGNRQKAFADLNHGIEVTATISKNEWKYHSELKLELDPSLPLVYCLIDEINQVILNMIINASHAIQERFKHSNEKLGLIIISTNHDDKNVIIKVSDNGAGISPAIINKIFDPFFTTKEVGKGTGQGLAIAHDIIVNKHKGSINVSSELGKGTTFEIIIPKESNGN